MLTVSIVIPYKRGYPLNVPIHDPNDEIIIKEEGGIGEARIAGAKKARNEWIVMTDSDAVYPKDYIKKVKDSIASGKYPYGFRARCVTRLRTRVDLESGIIVKKEVFLQHTLKFVSDHRIDVGSYLNDLPLVPSIVYYHSLTHNEMTVIIISTIISIVCIATLALRKKKVSNHA